jgi:hypothetical protein
VKLIYSCESAMRQVTPSDKRSEKKHSHRHCPGMAGKSVKSIKEIKERNARNNREKKAKNNACSGAL